MGLVPRTLWRSFDCIRPGPFFANRSIHLKLSSDILMKYKMLTSFRYRASPPHPKYSSEVLCNDYEI
jgi:hypothetical protein